MNVLILDDDPQAAELLQHELKRAGFDARAEVVDTPDAFQDRLSPELDLILLDFSLRGFNALDALRWVRERNLDIPCIVVTGAIDDESVSECVRHGAADYLIKDRLARLGSAVQHALEQKKQRDEQRRMEKALAESERRQATLLSNLPGIAYRCKNDPEWTMEFVSDGCTAMTGYKPAELIDNRTISFRTLIHPDDRERVWEEVQRAVTARRRFQIEYRITTVDGRLRWVWEQGCGTPGRDGTDLVLEGFIADITERKRADARFRETVEALPNPVLMVHRDGRILMANREAERAFGYSRDEIVGDLIERLVPARIRSVHPRFRDAYFEKAAIRRMGMSGCLTGCRKDGTEFPIEVALNPLETDQGPAVLVVAADVTRREEAERALRESEERYRSLVAASASVVWTADAEGRFVDPQSSWTDYTGQQTEQQSGFGWLDAIHPDDRQAVRSTWEQAVADRRLFIAEGRIWHAPGSRYRHFVARGVPLLNPDGLVREWVGTVTDVDDQKRAETMLKDHVQQMEALNVQLLESKRALEQAVDELGRSNSELDDFAYVASHDLKEPLRGIHNYAHFLLEDYADRVDEEGRNKLETLTRLTRRLDSLIDALLDYSRLGRSELSIGPTDLNEVIDEVVDTLHVTLHEYNVEIHRPRPLPSVECDRLWVAELLRNLITNAMKYNDKDKRWIEIGCRQGTSAAPGGSAPPAADDEGPITFYVRDNGIGIAPKHHESVFRIFRRLHGRNLYGGGTGAGLTIVKKIVERHGGNIWLESEPGQGTTFYFTLQGDEAHADASRHHEAVGAACGG